MTKTKRNKIIVGVSAIFAMAIILTLVFNLPVESLAPVTIDSDVTTFTLISYVDGEDVSDVVRITTWVPKSASEFDEFEDRLTMSKYETDDLNKLAEDVELDMRDIDFALVEIDHGAVSLFANHFYLIRGGANYDRTFYVYDQSTDVNFNVLNSTLGAITIADYQTDGNHTIVMDVPHETMTAAQLHVGDDWDVEDSDWDDMSTSEKEVYYDEANWACQAPVYVPADDDAKNLDDDLEQITNAFAIKFQANHTISTVDGALNQMNITLDKNIDGELVIDGVYFYIVFYEAITFDDGVIDFSLELTFAANITLTSAYSGRISVPKDDDGLTGWSAYSAAGA